MNSVIAILCQLQLIFYNLAADLLVLTAHSTIASTRRGKCIGKRNSHEDCTDSHHTGIPELDQSIKKRSLTCWSDLRPVKNHELDLVLHHRVSSSACHLRESDRCWTGVSDGQGAERRTGIYSESRWPQKPRSGRLRKLPRKVNSQNPTNRHRRGLKSNARNHNIRPRPNRAFRSLPVRRGSLETFTGQLRDEPDRIANDKFTERLPAGLHPRVRALRVDMGHGRTNGPQRTFYLTTGRKEVNQRIP
ncbi:uncharacterized protein BO80DRAFT_245233 [Aspergillus ibericus CBS 121593]|uniref:Secreted protein n=1 Tax=Aspergillus ibericus CBS 121593 TaxID=1448316 RepID=A0A395GKF8_9EURO|nr:hypothetical protein BO80DRAFT_245233 [Aspergillus ibericus CBS 121593]RAK95975.1 hypothetical protein BO80DRAFT_245233 [Aspergillus ibericus CBS 121593]